LSGFYSSGTQEKNKKIVSQALNETISLIHIEYCVLLHIMLQIIFDIKNKYSIFAGSKDLGNVKKNNIYRFNLLFEY
jgi:hypothetical protein